MKRLRVTEAFLTNATEMATAVAKGTLKTGTIYILEDTGTIVVATGKQTYSGDIKAGYTGSKGYSGSLGYTGSRGYTGSAA